MLTLVSSHSLPVYMKNDEYLGTSYLVMYFGNAGYKVQFFLKGYYDN